MKQKYWPAELQSNQIETVSHDHLLGSEAVSEKNP